MNHKKAFVQELKSLPYLPLNTENVNNGHLNEFQVFLTDRYRNFDIFPKMSEEEKVMYRRMQVVTNFFQEGCLVRAAVMGAGGGMLGILCGSFMFGMKHVDVNPDANWRQTIKHTYSNFFRHATKTGKDFMKLGFLYSFIECLVIKERAKHDILTALISGCATGAALGYKGGPIAMASGCIGFGFFSCLMERLGPYILSGRS
ncbi:uncharacterized protein LOC128882845 [Hylaeus volcanicus]|uniref:uncharacterized protein LOC128882845 n=1 Tax=Hylaeus volcanicus TaxID=313075 RepID=UPI0023B8454B|nr:uncharacterized protein LOC128882845 [Hylaeus volcanicus]